MIALLAILAMQVRPLALNLKVDGVPRQAIVFPGAGLNRAAPVVFVFHGRGSNALQASGYAIQNLWPEAVVIYPQGLPSGADSGQGWQSRPGEDGDRDVKFVDAILKSVKEKFKVSPHATYACGISNGAFFTFVLMRKRPDQFDGFASVAGSAGSWLKECKVPKPWLLIHGTADTLVPLKDMSSSREVLSRLNGCSSKSTPWAFDFKKFPGKAGNDLVIGIHSGGHMWSQHSSDGIARFFAELYRRPRA